MFGPEIIRTNKLFETALRTVWKNTCFFLRRQRRNFENVTLEARRRKHFRGLMAIFLVAQLPPKEVF